MTDDREMSDKSEQTVSLTLGLAAFVLAGLLALGGCSHEVRTYLKIVDSGNIRTYKFWHAASA